MDMSNFVELDRQLNYDPDQFIHFVRSRRSHRNFKDRSIPREDLTRLVDLCRYTPKGSNRQELQIVVVQDQDRRKRLSDHTVDFFESHTNELVREAQRYEAEGLEVPQVTKSNLTMLDTLKLVVLARQLGMDPIFYSAPAVMIFHSHTDSSCPKDDCVIASTTVTLAARTMSLGTCYIGLFDFVANRYDPIIEELDLPAGHRVFSTLILGYPKLTFLRAVDRNPMQVRWL
jgi:nitroreductase